MDIFQTSGDILQHLRGKVNMPTKGEVTQSV